MVGQARLGGLGSLQIWNLAWQGFSATRQEERLSSFFMSKCSTLLCGSLAILWHWDECQEFIIGQLHRGWLCFKSWAASSACSSVDLKGWIRYKCLLLCVDINVWLCTLHALLWDAELAVVLCDFSTLWGQAWSFSIIVVVQHFQASI